MTKRSAGPRTPQESALGKMTDTDLKAAQRLSQRHTELSESAAGCVTGSAEWHAFQAAINLVAAQANTLHADIHSHEGRAKGAKRNGATRLLKNIRG